MNSPEVEFVRWGAIKVKGHPQLFRDVKLYPGGAEEWDWKKTNTHHSPGIGMADVNDLIRRGAEIIVFSTGYHDMLMTKSEVIHSLEKSMRPYHILNTKDAVEKYNQLRQIYPVGALIHTTC